MSPHTFSSLPSNNEETPPSPLNPGQREGIGKGPPRNVTPVPWAPGQPSLHVAWVSVTSTKTQYLSCEQLVWGSGWYSALTW